MKIASRLLPLVLALGVCRGAPLTTTTAVQTAPDAAAPAIGYLKTGTEPVSAGPAPEGWMAVALPGPFSGYVKMGDFTTALTHYSAALSPLPSAHPLAFVVLANRALERMTSEAQIVAFIERVSARDEGAHVRKLLERSLRARRKKAA